MPAVSSDDPLEAAAAEIARAGPPGSVAAFLLVGEIVLCRFYGGDAELYRRHGPKHVSLRRLAALLGEGGIDASALSRAVKAHLVLRGVEVVRASRHLTPSHLRVALPLPPADCLRLLRRAEAGRWSTRQLSAVVSRHRQGKTVGCDRNDSGLIV